MSTYRVALGSSSPDLSAEEQDRLQATQPAQYRYYSPARSILFIMVSISLQPESGYVFLVVAGTAILNMYQMLKVDSD